MGSKTTFEWKETWETSQPPGIPEKFPWDASWIMGASYPASAPITLITPDQAYSIAIQAVYWSWTRAPRRWECIGDAGKLLVWLQGATRLEGYVDWRISWPEAFENAYRFNRPESVQVLPWRELLRRHFDQDAYIADYDMFIDDTYRRKRCS